MATFVRNVGCLLRSKSLNIAKAANHNYIPVCGVKRWVKSVHKDLYERRIEQGPEPDRHRSVWPNWNYDAEVFAFGKRLGEEFKDQTLKLAFTDRSYVEKEAERRQSLGVEDFQLELEDNSQLAQKGEEIARNYILAYLRHSLPLLPEEGIRTVCDYLLSAETLAYIAGNLGFTDLILCEELPPSAATYSESFKAVVGGLAEDCGEERAQLFVQDFVLTQLVDKPIDSIWVLHNPMGVLADVLQAQGRGEPEPRLVFQTGSRSMLAAYCVGIYSDKKMIGKFYGETVTIAEEMAARDALRRLFRIDITKPTFSFGQEGRNLKLDFNKRNTSLADYAKAQLS